MQHWASTAIICSCRHMWLHENLKAGRISLKGLLTVAKICSKPLSSSSPTSITALYLMQAQLVTTATLLKTFCHYHSIHKCIKTAFLKVPSPLHTHTIMMLSILLFTLAWLFTQSLHYLCSTALCEDYCSQISPIPLLWCCPANPTLFPITYYYFYYCYYYHF